MRKTVSIVLEWLKITAATAIAAAAVYFFLIPSHVSVGSVSGLAMILANIIPLSVSVLTMILNVVLLLLGFLLVGREFGAKTVYTSILVPVFLGIFERVFPLQASLTGDAFVDMIGFVLLSSVGIAILFNANASSGGLDIVSKILNKFLHIELGTASMLAGMCVAVSSVFFYDAKIMVISVIGTYLSGVVLDHFILGFAIKKRICIISEKLEEIKRFVLGELHSGATLYRSEGAYTGEARVELQVIVNRSEYAKLMSFIEKTDRNAFVTVYTVNKVIYRPKTRG